MDPRVPHPAAAPHEAGWRSAQRKRAAPARVLAYMEFLSSGPFRSFRAPNYRIETPACRCPFDCRIHDQDLV